MFLELFHMLLSWCHASILYPCGHKHAYALSAFLPQTRKRDNQFKFVKQTLKVTKNLPQNVVRKK